MSDKGQIQSPGDFIREEMVTRGWTQRDLAQILDRPLPTVNEIINAKRAIMPDMAIALGNAFANSPELWMQRESAYRLSLADSDQNDVRDRARLYELGPIKEMVKRGWINPSKDSSESLHSELKNFFDQPLDQELSIGANLRSSIDGPVNAAQRAWCFRAKQLAKSIKVAKYNTANFNKGIKRLKRLAAWPEHASKVPTILADMGIRLVVIEPLMRTRIDGAALWLDEDSPIVALSVRYDRIDSFWHTLGHELSHIQHRDGFAIDIDMVGESRQSPPEQTGIERRADQDAVAMWLDQEELQSFVVRVGPLYNRSRINQFANRLKIHPGIIVGQLQHRGEVGYQAFREMLTKVRAHLTDESLTDGWGHTVTM